MYVVAKKYISGKNKSTNESSKHPFVRKLSTNFEKIKLNYKPRNGLGNGVNNF